ncbi:MAG: glutamate racemase [Anaerolineae bacterium]|nr:glutamate racemase [Anaerolineae bacterium]
MNTHSHQWSEKETEEPGSEKIGERGSIGVFDSGVGGLSVWREITRELPNEDTLYVADQAHLPYGPRPLAEVRQFTEDITHFLLTQGAKLIVVACNTASGAALHYLRETFPEVPFVGMEPALKPAAEHTQTGIIGVIATPGTFQGDLFQQLAVRFANNVKIHIQPCPGLVTAVETGALDTLETRALLRQYLLPMLEANIDHLVLGCTHYPFLSQTIQEIIGPNITLIDPAPAVARQVRRVLAHHKLLVSSTRKPQHRFYTSGNPEQLATAARALVELNVTVKDWY